MGIFDFLPGFFNNPKLYGNSIEMKKFIFWNNLSLYFSLGGVISMVGVIVRQYLFKTSPINETDYILVGIALMLFIFARLFRQAAESCLHPSYNQ